MNSLKTFMNKVGDRVRESTPQGASIVDGTDPRNEEMEGFVCPSCFKKFSSPVELEQHYSEQHLDPSANYLCPVCKARLNSQQDLEQHYTLNHGEKNLTNLTLEALKDELKELSTNLREERWYSEELKNEIERLQEAFKKKDDDGVPYVHQAQLDAVEESKKMLSSEVILLRKQYSDSLEQMRLLRIEKELFEQRASNFAVERAELRATLDSLEAEKVVEDAELADLRNALSKNEVCKQEEMENAKNELCKTESVVEAKSKKIHSLKDNELALQNDLKNKSEATAALKEEMRNLKMEIDLMKMNLQEKSEETISLQTKVKELEVNSENKLNTEIENIRVESKQETNSEEIDSESKMTQCKEEISTLRVSCLEAESRRAHAEQLLREKMREDDALRDEASAALTSLQQRDETLVVIEDNLRFREAQVEQLNKDKLVLEEKQAMFEVIKEEVQKLIEQLEETKKDREKLMAEKVQAEMEGSEAYKRAEQLSADVSQSAKELDDEKTASQTISEERDSLKNKLALLAQEAEASRASVATLQGNNHVLQQEADALSTRLEAAQLRAEKLETMLTQAKEGAQQTEGTLRLAAETVENTMQEEVTTLKEKLAILQREKEAVDVQVADAEQTLSLVTADRDEAVADNTKVNIDRENLNEQIKANEVSSKTLSDTISNFKKEVLQLKGGIASLTKLVNSYKEQKSNLELNLSSDQSKLCEAESRLASQEADMAVLAGDKLELEVKCEAGWEERRALVERCVQAESEVDKSHTELTQLRRKLDDSTAGLHELGRENQALRIETSKLSGRKWAEDSDAPNCSRCEKTFSMTVRRHHCRNCFQIFCGECSSKQASLDSSKKAVRVCQACYTEVTARM